MTEIPQCANPLFAQWLKEWLDDSKVQTTLNKSSYSYNMQYVYKKAYENMLKFPIPLRNGKEAVKVAGVGAKLAERLDKRLQEFNQNQAIGMLQEPSELMVASCEKEATEVVMGSQEDVSQSQKKKRAAIQRKPKEYIPVYRSGGYAIMLALYLHTEEAGFLTKGDVIRLAQPYCDASFKTGNPAHAGTASGFYTAWGSIKTLIEKDLVVKRGNPARFSLTDLGREVAMKMDALSGSQMSESNPKEQYGVIDLLSDDSNAGPPKKSPKKTKRQQRKTASSSSLLNASQSSVTTVLEAVTASEGISSTLGTGIIAYVTADDKETLLKQLATVKMEPSNIYFKVKCFKQPPSKFMSEIVHIEKSTDTYVVGYLCDQKAPTVFKVGTQAAEEEEANELVLPELEPKVTIKRGKSSWDECQSKRLPEGIDTDISAAEISPDSLREILCKNERCMRKGEYQICIVIDNREVRNQRDRTFFQTGLMRMGHEVITLPLVLGDAMIVARPINGDGPMLVLDVLVERKTTDDLVASIKDGRWKEQKYRLQTCGLTDIVYLVEEHVSEGARVFGLDKIESALCHTQMCSGIYVKRTSGMEDTLAYLSAMVEHVRKRLCDLYMLPEELCSKETINETRRMVKQTHTGRNYFLSIDCFQEMNSKTKNLTLGELFKKQLLTIRGLSAEKVAMISKLYPTARALRQAYFAILDDKEQELMLKKTCAGPPRHNIGPALSKKIYELFNLEYLSVDNK